MVVCCHLQQHAPTGTVVRVKSCINSRYPGQMMGWPASSTITLFKFNKINNSYDPPPILHHHKGIRNLSVLRGEERTQPSSPAWSLLGQGAHRSALLRAEEGAVWEPQQHTHQQVHGAAAAWQWSPTPRYLSKTCRILSHLFMYIWNQRYFKCLQGTGLLLYRKVLLNGWLFGLAIISSYWITD